MVRTFTVVKSEDVVTLSDIYSLVANEKLALNVTMWVDFGDGGISVPVNKIKISDCTMPDGSHENITLQLECDPSELLKESKCH